jgi:hypothetical protein
VKKLGVNVNFSEARNILKDMGQMTAPRYISRTVNVVKVPPIALLMKELEICRPLASNVKMWLHVRPEAGAGASSGGM